MEIIYNAQSTSATKYSAQTKPSFWVQISQNPTGKISGLSLGSCPANDR